MPDSTDNYSIIDYIILQHQSTKVNGHLKKIFKNLKRR